MNKAELIEVVAESVSGISKADATRAVDAVLSGINEALVKGDQVTIVGFGTFKVKHRKARKGRNPKTGEEMDIAASNSVGFKAGKALKDALN